MKRSKQPLVTRRELENRIMRLETALHEQAKAITLATIHDLKHRDVLLPLIEADHPLDEVIDAAVKRIARPDIDRLLAEATKRREALQIGLWFLSDVLGFDDAVEWLKFLRSLRARELGTDDTSVERAREVWRMGLAARDAYNARGRP